MSFWKTLTGAVAERSPETASRGSGRRDLGIDPKWRKRLHEGYVWADSMIMPRPCTIREMSPLMATVELWHDDIKASSLRSGLRLYSSVDRKEAPCVVAGRDGRVLKLRFQGPFQAATRRYE